MFVLVEMVDTVRIPPWQFERKLNDSIAEELNKKLANKVLGPPAGVRNPISSPASLAVAWFSLSLAHLSNFMSGLLSSSSF